MKKITSIKLSEEWNGRTLQEVYDFVKKEYPNRLATDSVDLYEQIPKDDNYHFFFGSRFRNSVGYWSVPYVVSDASGLRRNSFWLASSWLGNCRVVILDKQTIEPLKSEITLETLNKKLDKILKKI